MPFIPNLEDATDPTILPDGEHEVRISKLSKKLSRGGNLMLVAVLEPINEPLAQSIFERMSMPNESHNARTQNFMLNNIKKFCQCFGLDLGTMNAHLQEPLPDGVDEVELPEAAGATAWVMVGTEKSDDYGERNKVKSWGNAVRR